MLDIGQSEDWLALQISLLPCLLGYGAIARRLHDLQSTNPPKQANRYLTWINNYVAEDYSAAVREGSGERVQCELYQTKLTRDVALIEKHASKQSPSRVEELVAIFIHATKASPCQIGVQGRLADTILTDGGRVLGHGLDSIGWRAFDGSVVNEVNDSGSIMDRDTW